MLNTLQITDWNESISSAQQNEAMSALESGLVIFLPQLNFTLSASEQNFLDERYASPNTKNISYSTMTNRLQGMIGDQQEQSKVTEMMMRFLNNSRRLVNNLLPAYGSHLTLGRTSYRPVEIAGRKAPSYRKDDTRLHVDAFPANPTNGHRILRVFSNVNPFAKPRVWRLGEPFESVVKQFENKLSKPFFGSATSLKLLRVTKNKRSHYDHYMLQLHNKMKADLTYQQTANQQEVHFPAGSTWIVYTDQVSHAAMSGQFTFEQTFYLPPCALVQPETSPLKVLEKTFAQSLL